VSWGVGSASTESQPGGGASPEPSAGKRGNQPNYDLTFERLFSENSEGRAPGLGHTATYLSQIGINTPRDALVCGGQYITNSASWLGVGRADVLRQELAKIFPDTPLSDAPDPEIGARLCDSLEEVPASIFGFGNVKDRRLSAQYLIDHATLNALTGEKTLPIQGNTYERARRKALAYAEKFEEAKRAQQ
jgi:hypothetical protein